MSSPFLSAVPMAFVLAGVVLYAVLAGADFGAGFWTLIAGSDERGAQIREEAHHSMGPVWEANHVWLIFVLTVFWTAYPAALGSIASTLAAPLGLAGIGIILRGATYALRSGASGPRESMVLDTIFSLSSILTPFALGTIVGTLAIGKVVTGNDAGNHFTSWLSLTPLLDGVIAVSTAAYLAAVFLAGDSTRRGHPELAAAFRQRALVAGLVAGALAVAGLIAVHHDSHALYHELSAGRALPAVIVSAVGGIATLALVYARRFEPARYSAALAIAAVLVGWALAQWPHILPDLTIRQAATVHDALIAVIIAVLAGGAIVFPSLVWLFRLSLRGQFDPVSDVEEHGQDAPRPDGIWPGGPAAAGRVAVAMLIVGVGLLVFVDAKPAHAVGVAALLAFVVAGFIALAPALLPDEPRPQDSPEDGEASGG
ncbi:MAG TPA: cytochrome d ubiquinol oxidase subunit II [Solirubrobacteraceae bacterium]|nr:cytochrome d ubiquinol oxidase subunit II [Solirubrobacteraceae bacterium]